MYPSTRLRRARLQSIVVRYRKSCPDTSLEREEEYVVTFRLNQYHFTPMHMRSVNKVILVGHVAADPESLEAKTGMTRVTFPIATHREYTSDGERKEVTDYHRVVTWGKLAEISAKYLTKGQGVYVEGTLLNRAYEKDGERKYITEIRADEISMLSWKRKGGVEKVSLDSIENVGVNSEQL